MPLMRAAILTLTAVLAVAALSAPVPGPRPLKLPIELRFEGATRNVAFHPAGGLLAVGQMEGAVVILDIAAGKEVAAFKKEQWTNPLAFSPGQGLFAFADGGVVRT